MLFWKKKQTIDRIDKMLVSCEQVEPDNDAFVFSLHLERRFTNNAKDGLKPILQDFILVANEKIYKDCYWAVFAYDFKPFFLSGHKEREISAHLLANNSILSHVIVEEYHISMLINEMNEKTFYTLSNTTLPNGKMLSLDVFGASFLAFHADDINTILASILFTDIDEMANVCFKQKFGMQIFYADRPKTNKLFISCSPDKKKEVKNCLIEVFNAHGIQLEFTGEDSH